MHKESILYILESNDISKEHLDIFRDKLKDKNFTIDDCDVLLQKLNYEKIFNLEEYEDEEYVEYENSDDTPRKKLVKELE